MSLTERVYAILRVEDLHEAVGTQRGDEPTKLAANAKRKELNTVKKLPKRKNGGGGNKVARVNVILTLSNRC